MLAQLVRIGFIAIASVGVFSFVRAARNDHQRTSCAALCALSPAYANNDRRVPDFELPDLHGERVRFSRLLGRRPVVLNFWTKACKPCLEEMPSLGHLAQTVADEGIEVVTVCTDDGPAAVRDELQALFGGSDPPFRVLFDPESEIVGGKFGTTLFPETWLIDQRGIVRVRVDGARDWSDPLVREVIDMIGRPSGCPARFARGAPAGPFRGLCGDE